MIVHLLLAAAESSSLSSILLSFAPILFFLGVLFFVFRRVQRKNRTYIDNARAHMAAMEKKSDRIIELLEELNRSNRQF